MFACIDSPSLSNQAKHSQDFVVCIDVPTLADAGTAGSRL